VPRIRLRVAERLLAIPCAYHEPHLPGTSQVPLPLLRLTAPAVVQAPPAVRSPGCSVTALIDTGCWLSVVELHTWQDYEAAGLLEQLPSAGSQTTFVAGHAVAVQLGRLWVTLIDPTPPRIRSLPAVPVVAQLLLQPTPLLQHYPLILGLHRGVWYGQEWYLESA
jgi:hypothetical protein